MANRSNPSVSAVLALIVALSFTLHAKRQFKNDRAAADSFHKKVDFIKNNATSENPSAKATVFSQEEVNAYFAERRLKMPEGVKTVTFELEKDLVRAFTRVDFEQMRRSRPNMNPLLAIFDGIHDCEVIAETQMVSPGIVRVNVESVRIDGMKVPKMALRMFIDHYVKPKYPNVGLDAEYKLPVRIDSAVIEREKGTIRQK